MSSNTVNPFEGLEGVAFDPRVFKPDGVGPCPAIRHLQGDMFTSLPTPPIWFQIPRPGIKKFLFPNERGGGGERSRGAPNIDGYAPRGY